MRSLIKASAVYCLSGGLIFLAACGQSTIDNNTSMLADIVAEPLVPSFDTAELLPGGSASQKRLNHRTFIEPGKHIALTEQLAFWNGLTFFKDPWVIAPSSTADRDGLGPLFNTRSCVTCHSKGSRSKMPEVGISKPSGLLVRLGGKSPAQPDWQDPVYGGQIQVRAIDFKHNQLHNPVMPEAKVSLQYTTITGTFADGQPYTLQKPHVGLVDLAYGELHANTGLSARLGPNIFGMGLLDAIAERDLLALEDINDSDQDGISAKYNRVPDEINHRSSVGRFGFKAKHPTLTQQVAAAFIGDIGITNLHFRQDNCTAAQTACQQAVELGQHADKVEIADHLFDFTLFFSRHLAVPPARDLSSDVAQQGRTLFYQAKCQTCHQPRYVTRADYPAAELRNITIWPYTDLALHDMGSELADEVHEYSATPQEWRTPPLWGIGMQKQILGQARFLHDGRARSIEEAILWHGGEAAASQQAYTQFTLVERQALLAFLNAI